MSISFASTRPLQDSEEAMPETVSDEIEASSDHVIEIMTDRLEQLEFAIGHIAQTFADEAEVIGGFADRLTQMSERIEMLPDRIGSSPAGEDAAMSLKTLHSDMVAGQRALLEQVDMLTTRPSPVQDLGPLRTALDEAISAHASSFTSDLHQVRERLDALSQTSTSENAEAPDDDTIIRATQAFRYMIQRNERLNEETLARLEQIDPLLSDARRSEEEDDLVMRLAEKTERLEDSIAQLHAKLDAMGAPQPDSSHIPPDTPPTCIAEDNFEVEKELETECDLTPDDHACAQPSDSSQSQTVTPAEEPNEMASKASADLPAEIPEFDGAMQELGEHEVSEALSDLSDMERQPEISDIASDDPQGLEPTDVSLDLANSSELSELSEDPASDVTDASSEQVSVGHENDLASSDEPSDTLNDIDDMTAPVESFMPEQNCHELSKETPIECSGQQDPPDDPAAEVVADLGVPDEMALASEEEQASDCTMGLEQAPVPEAEICAASSFDMTKSPEAEPLSQPSEIEAELPSPDAADSFEENTFEPADMPGSDAETMRLVSSAEDNLAQITSDGPMDIASDTPLQATLDEPIDELGTALSAEPQEDSPTDHSSPDDIAFSGPTDQSLDALNSTVPIDLQNLSEEELALVQAFLAGITKLRAREPIREVVAEIRTSC